MLIIIITHILLLLHIIMQHYSQPFRVLWRSVFRPMALLAFFSLFKDSLSWGGEQCAGDEV